MDNKEHLDSSASTRALSTRAIELISNKGSNLGSQIVSIGSSSCIVPSEFYTYLGYLVDRERVDIVIELIDRLATERDLYYREHTMDLKIFLNENRDNSLLLKALLNYIHYRENNLPTGVLEQFSYKEFITGYRQVNDRVQLIPRTIVYYLRNEPLTDVEPAFFHDISEAIQLVYTRSDQDKRAKYWAIFDTILPELILIVTSERESSKRLNEALSFITGLKRLSDTCFDVRDTDPVLDKELYTHFITNFLAELTPAQLLTLPKTAIKYILWALDDEGVHKTTFTPDGNAAKHFRDLLRMAPAFGVAHEAYQVDAQIRINTPTYIRTYLKLNDPDYFNQFEQSEDEKSES